MNEVGEILNLKNNLAQNLREVVCGLSGVTSCRICVKLWNALFLTNGFLFLIQNKIFNRTHKNGDSRYKVKQRLFHSRKYIIKNRF